VNGLVAGLLLDKPKGLYLSSFKCMSRWLVDEITRYPGPYPYVDGLALRTTSDIHVVEVPHHERAQGRSGYTLRKLIRLWLIVFINFSVRPLRAATLLGGLFVVVAFVGAAWVMVERLTTSSLPEGWAFLAIAVTAFSGAQLVMLGLAGEYLGRVLLTVSRTPQYVVRERLVATRREDDTK
jgi:undecaprenyl-phosphate 4-deoxy-4-formamido-L-arabinose transferase